MPIGQDMHAAQSGLHLYSLDPPDMICPIRTMIRTANKANLILSYMKTNLFYSWKFGLIL
jgi:hypothetical protein